MKLGIISPSEIAFRRFMPAILKNDFFTFEAIAMYSQEERFEHSEHNMNSISEVMQNERNKIDRFVYAYPGRIHRSYQDLIKDDDIEAVYIPLPPALHYYWAKEALYNGKHVLMEKPFSLNLSQTQELINIARQRNLALHENYMFVFHNQISDIKNVIERGEIGEVRLLRLAFGFPRRSSNDFRYSKEMGGGAFLDAGGYTIKLASMMLGDNICVESAKLNYKDEFDVDLYGSGTLIDSDGVTAQIAFGMDNNYKCEMEVWGSKGTIYTNRIFTAPVDYEPIVFIRKGNEENTIKILKDDTFGKSIDHFRRCILDEEIRNQSYKEIEIQAQLMQMFINKLGECKI